MPSIPAIPKSFRIEMARFPKMDDSFEHLMILPLLLLFNQLWKHSGQLEVIYDQKATGLKHTR